MGDLSIVADILDSAVYADKEFYVAAAAIAPIVAERAIRYTEDYATSELEYQE